MVRSFRSGFDAPGIRTRLPGQAIARGGGWGEPLAQRTVGRTVLVVLALPNAGKQRYRVRFKAAKPGQEAPGGHSCDAVGGMTYERPAGWFGNVADGSDTRDGIGTPAPDSGPCRYGVYALANSGRAGRKLAELWTLDQAVRYLQAYSPRYGLLGRLHRERPGCCDLHVPQ